MPFYNHEGGSEASGDKGEKYRQAIEDYLRARGYSIERRSNHHGTTEDLAAVNVNDKFHCLNGEKVGEEFKKFVRIEAKDTSLSRLEKSFVTELARIFIDYCEQDGEFEYHIYASGLQAPKKWKQIFDPRMNTTEAVEDYFGTLEESHDLNDAEEEVFQQYEIEDFEWFLTDVFVHQAGWNRLGQMTEDEQSVDRSKWDFYTRENSPYRKAETLVANFLRISHLPESIYIGEDLSDHPEDIYDDNPRYLPIWVEGNTFYSLLSVSEMSDSLQEFVDVESIQSHPFDRWLQDEEGISGIAKRLFNRAIRYRVVERYDACKMVRHQHENPLLFEHEKRQSEDDSPNKTKVGGWDVAMDWGEYTAHRYSVPQVRRYQNQFHVFIDTGWMFSRSGRGVSIIDGDLASRLHDKLQSSGHYRPNNVKAQFRQWRAYLGMDEEIPSGQTARGDEPNLYPQWLGFDQEDGLELRVRPPKDTSERALLMERGVDTY